ncbi:MAG: hypothetical protein R2735_14665 [Microthrixaceae bacterium]
MNGADGMKGEITVRRRCVKVNWRQHWTVDTNGVKDVEKKLNMADVVESSLIEGVYLVTPRVFGDDRGYFVETYRKRVDPSGREMIQGNRGDRISGCMSRTPLPPSSG